MHYATSSGHGWPKIFSFLTHSHATYAVLAAPPPHFLLGRQKELDQHLSVATSCNGESQGRARCSLYPGVPCPSAALHSQGVMLMVCLAASSVPGPPAARICCTITLAHSFLPWQDRPELNFSIETGKQRLCFFSRNKV